MGRLTFRGIHPAGRKGSTRRKPLAALDQPPERVYIPLEMCAGCAPAIAAVKPGDHVWIGQPIAIPGDDAGVTIHASVSGTVVAVEEHPHPWGGTAPTVVIQNDGTNTYADALAEPIDPAHLIPQVLINRLRQSGIVGMGGDAAAIHQKVAQAIGRVGTLIVNAAECEPYVTADQRLLTERGDQILQGASELARAIRAKRVVLAAEGDQLRTVEKLERILLKKKSSVELLTLRTRYPLGSEKQLIQAVNGRETPPGGNPVDVKCLVLNVATVYAIHDALLLGKPVTHRAVTVSGGGVGRPRNLWVPIGTPLNDLLACAGGLREENALIFTGGPMRPVAQTDLSAPVVMDTNSLICMTQTERAVRGPETPCVRCGRCAAACPMRLVPAFIARSVRLNELGRLPVLHPQDCLECGCCTYVCPSQIPLMSLVRQARQLLSEGGESK